MSGIDAVDGSSTGTRVPWMWALLRLPRFRGATHAEDHDNGGGQMMRKGGLALVFSMVAVAVHAQQPSHSSGFPAFRQFNLISINGAVYSDRLRSLNINLAGNGNSYAVGFAGCHGWGGQIQTLDHDQIKFDLITLTQGQPQGACNPAQQKAEDEFVDALKQASRWRVREAAAMPGTSRHPGNGWDRPRRLRRMPAGRHKKHRELRVSGET